jgi:hypothetical protein
MAITVIALALTIIALLGVIALLVKKLSEQDDEICRLKNEITNLRCIKRRREQKIY